MCFLLILLLMNSGILRIFGNACSAKMSYISKWHNRVLAQCRKSIMSYAVVIKVCCLFFQRVMIHIILPFA